MRFSSLILLFVAAALSIAFAILSPVNASPFKGCNQFNFCKGLRGGEVQRFAEYAVSRVETTEKTSQVWKQLPEGNEAHALSSLRILLESRNAYSLQVNRDEDTSKTSEQSSSPAQESEQASADSQPAGEGAAPQPEKTLNDYLKKKDDGSFLLPKQLFQPLLVDVFYFKPGIFRVQLKEKANEHKKPVEDVLVVKAEEGLMSIKDEGQFLLVTARDNAMTSLKIYKTDFRIEFIQNGVVTSVLNKDSFLYIDSVDAEKSIKAISGDLYKGSVGTFSPTLHSEKIGGASAFDVYFPNSKHVYGIPERATDLSLKSTNRINGEPYRLFNLDVFRFKLNDPLGLYASIPFMISLGENTSGVFALNPSNAFVDVDKMKEGIRTNWMHEAGLLDLFFIPGPTPSAVVKNYIKLTGTPTLPQKFSLGYHQCRWNYKDEDDVFQVNVNFNKLNIPFDVLWLDIEHTDSKKYFTWDASNFPTPLAMQSNLKRDGRKLVTISDPHIKVDHNYHVFKEGEKKQYFVKNSSGQRFEGDCWPGKSSWLDYFNPEIRDWYASLYAFDKYEGSADNLYTWIDMNEPSVFNSPEVTMPPDNIHYGDRTHREVHNMYGFYHGVSTNLGHLRRRNYEDRPFILTRSFFSGSQRYVAAWTGDNTGDWSHLKKTPAMLLAVSISGFPFIGADVGGFFDNPDSELLVRWYQSGAFYPFFRAHAHIETRRREPWLFGDENTKLIREAIIRRYVLLPYYYTLSFESSVNGLPLMRPLFFEFPEDDRTHDEENQFLIGDSLMIAPVADAGIQRMDVYFPQALWYEWKNNSLISDGSSMKSIETPLDYVPIFQRGGSIIPTQERVRRSSTMMKFDPYTLRIALSEKKSASGSLYIDDGSSYDFKKGEYLVRSFTFEPTATGYVLVNSAGKLEHAEKKPDNSFSESVTNSIERIVIAGVDKKPTKIFAEKILNDATLVDVNILLQFEYNEQDKVLIIRKPQLLVREDWEIHIE